MNVIEMKLNQTEFFSRLHLLFFRKETQDCSSILCRTQALRKPSRTKFKMYSDSIRWPIDTQTLHVTKALIGNLLHNILR